MSPSKLKRFIKFKRHSTNKRREANKLHRTYQSDLETEKRGWIPQRIVNKILGRYHEW